MLSVAARVSGVRKIGFKLVKQMANVIVFVWLINYLRSLFIASVAFDFVMEADDRNGINKRLIGPTD